jgi:hypothetical protein
VFRPGESTTLCAAECGQLEVLQFLFMHGCPIDVMRCIRGAGRAQPACHAWLVALTKTRR